MSTPQTLLVGDSHKSGDSLQHAALTVNVSLKCGGGAVLKGLLGVSRDTDSGETLGIDCPGIPEALAGGPKVHYD